MDNCKYQSLYIGLISYGKIRFRFVLLGRTVNALIAHAFPNATPELENNKRGKWGMDYRFLPHVCDTMTMFDEAWAKMQRFIIIKC